MKLYKTDTGVFYQIDNGKQVPISDPAQLRDLYSGNSGSQYETRAMTSSPAIDSTTARTIPELGASNAGLGQSQDPQSSLALFNSQVQNLMQRFQNAPTSEEAYKALYKSEQQAASQGFMPLDPSLIGAAPGDIQGTRNAGIAMFEPEQVAAKAKISADRDRASQFVELAKVAKEFGESFAKTLPMDDATAESLTAMIGSGEKFDEDILTKWSNSNYLKLNPGARTKALQGFAASKAKATVGGSNLAITYPTIDGKLVQLTTDKNTGEIISITPLGTANSESGAFELKNNALTSATSLLDKFNAGQTSAVGGNIINRLGAVGDTLYKGSSRADFIVQLDNLKSLLSLDNVKYLKGQGQVSDAERRLLEQASAKLDRSQSDAEFKRALTDIKKALEGSSASSNPQGQAGAVDYRNKYNY